MRIYIVRHGEVQRGSLSRLFGDRFYGARPGLSRQGREEAQTIATKLVEDGVDVSGVFTTPMTRAKETAVPIVESLQQRTPHGIWMNPFPEFRDVELGELVGQRVGPEVKGDQNVWALEGKVNGLEGYQLFAKRIDSGLRTIDDAYPPEDRVFVVHKEVAPAIENYYRDPNSIVPQRREDIPAGIRRGADSLRTGEARVLTLDAERQVIAVDHYRQMRGPHGERFIQVVREDMHKTPEGNRGSSRER